MQSFTATDISNGATSSELKTWLEATALFDAVTIDSESSPEKVICSIDDKQVVYFSHAAATQLSWNLFVRVNNDTAWTLVLNSGAIYLKYAIATTQAIVMSEASLHQVPSGNNRAGAQYIIGKTSDSGVACAYHGGRIGASGGPVSTQIVVTSTKDDTNGILYSNVPNTKSWGLLSYGAGPHDRTVLEKIPVAGQIGSTGYITTVFNTPITQFVGTTTFTLNGHNYVSVLGHLALLDE